MIYAETALVWGNEMKYLSTFGLGAAMILLAISILLFADLALWSKSASDFTGKIKDNLDKNIAFLFPTSHARCVEYLIQEQKAGRAATKLGAAIVDESTVALYCVNWGNNSRCALEGLNYNAAFPYGNRTEMNKWCEYVRKY
jgi:hypothetical protein